MRCATPALRTPDPVVPAIAPTVRHPLDTRSGPPVWLFDLDNTLHDALPEIMPRIDRDMTRYVVRALGVDHDQASRVRQDYWLRYGATLLGMIRHHQVDPHDFLREAHRFPDMDRLVRRSNRLAQMLRRLPGRKWVVTNAPRHYAHQVLHQLGVLPFVDGVVPIEEMTFNGHWQPKPSVPMFRRLVARHRIDPRRCVLIEDSAANLHGAKRCGMRTILIQGWAWRGRAGTRPLAGPGRRIDFQIQSVLTLPRIALR